MTKRATAYARILCDTTLFATLRPSIAHVAHTKMAAFTKLESGSRRAQVVGRVAMSARPFSGTRTPSAGPWMLNVRLIKEKHPSLPGFLVYARSDN